MRLSEINPIDPIVLKDLLPLQQIFNQQGFDIRIVGGAVRDMLLGKQPKDIDLCTSANPDEQIKIYEGNNYRYVTTGLQHGTITVVINGEPYEITSLRTESDHDGRHATVAYTRDWLMDLSRRDLTINAMSMKLNGELIDPFNGKEDLKNKVVRFVGDASLRIKEDYLRILRWIRFQGRINPNGVPNEESIDAIRANASGLKQISRERVWQEVSKIISGNGGPNLMQLMADLGINQYIDLPSSGYDFSNVFKRTKNPVTLMVSYLDTETRVAMIAAKWKWSGDEKNLAMFLAKFKDKEFDPKVLLAGNGFSREWVLELCNLTGVPIGDLRTWTVPVFPVNGDDLMKQGIKPGKDMGDILKRLKSFWIVSNYTATKNDLIQKI